MASACTALAGVTSTSLSLASSKSLCSTKVSPAKAAVLRRQERRQCARASSNSQEGSSLRHTVAAGVLAATLASGSPLLTPELAFAEPTHVYQLAASDNVPDEVNDVLSKAPSNVRSRVESNAAEVQEPGKAAFALGFPPAVLLGSAALILVTVGGLSQIFGTAKK